MGFRYAEGVKESVANKPASAATDFELAGAVSAAYRTIVAGIGDGNRSVFKAQKVDANGNPAGAWEVFVGTVTDGTPDTLSRDHLIRSTTGAFIDWSTSGEDSAPHISIVHPAQIGHLGLGPIPYVHNDIWYSPVWSTGNPTAANIEVAIFASPMVIAQPMILEGLRAQCSGGAAAGFTCRLGIYRPTGFASEPFELVYGSDAIDCSTTGIKAVTGLSVFLPPGLYFTAMIGSSNAMQFLGSGFSNADNEFCSYVLGNRNASSVAGGGIAGLRYNMSYGPMPGTVTFTDTRTANCPMTQARFAVPS